MSNEETEVVEQVEEQPIQAEPLEPDVPDDETAAEPAPAEDGEKQQQPAKPEGGIQKRINELTREKYQLQAERDAYRDIAKGKTLEAVKEPPAVAAKQKPLMDNFATTEEYMEALADYKAEEKIAAFRAELTMRAKAETLQNEQQAQAERWIAAENAFAEKNADYDKASAAGLETIKRLNTPACHSVAQAMQQVENGPELLYHFGKHPGEMEAIAKMAPIAAVMALGEIAARLAGDKPAKDKEPAPQTRAPRPPTPIRGASAAGSPKPDEPGSDKMSDEDWLKARNAQIAERQRR
jgi:hypothetical protein